MTTQTTTSALAPIPATHCDTAGHWIQDGLVVSYDNGDHDRCGRHEVSEWDRPIDRGVIVDQWWEGGEEETYTLWYSSRDAAVAAHPEMRDSDVANFGPKSEGGVMQLRELSPEDPWEPLNPEDDDDDEPPYKSGEVIYDRVGHGDRAQTMILTDYARMPKTGVILQTWWWTGATDRYYDSVVAAREAVAELRREVTHDEWDWEITPVADAD